MESPDDPTRSTSEGEPTDCRGEVVNPTPERLRTVAEATRARDRALELEARARFLAEASRVLASSLDYEATLQSVARLTVPALGDWCLVDVVGEDGHDHRVAVAHANPARADLASALEHAGPAAEGAPCSAPRVLRTGVSELAAEFTAADLATARDPERLQVLCALGIRPQMCVPLVARGHTLGAITLISAESGRDYGSDDLALAEDLAHRAALAVDNARLYHEAERANAAKSEFLATVSHELRAPLHVVLGYLDLLHSGIPEPIPDGAREQVARIRRASQDLLQLVEQLLSLSRLDAGRETVRVEPVDVGTLTREMALLVEPLADAKGLRFVMHPPDVPTTVVTDAGKLRQILYNLLANAVKFTERGQVTLAAQREGDRIVLEVRDTGIGIAPADLTRIFEAFWQVEQPAGDGRGGAGLGLSISQRLARLLGGDLSATSTVGEGTTFTVVLPLTQQPAPSPQRAD